MARSIYLLADPRQPKKGYIGQTRISVERRFAQHCGHAMRGNDLPVYRWMRKLQRLERFPTVTVLGTYSTDAEMNAAERAAQIFRRPAERVRPQRCVSENARPLPRHGKTPTFENGVQLVFDRR